jgi:hypothetical protein
VPQSSSKDAKEVSHHLGHCVLSSRISEQRRRNSEEGRSKNVGITLWAVIAGNDRTCHKRSAARRYSGSIPEQKIRKITEKWVRITQRIWRLLYSTQVLVDLWVGRFGHLPLYLFLMIYMHLFYFSQYFRLIFKFLIVDKRVLIRSGWVTYLNNP